MMLRMLNKRVKKQAHTQKKGYEPEKGDLRDNGKEYSVGKTE